MFEVGDFIIYGHNGVCRVKEVAKMKMPGAKIGRMSYTLSPIYSKGDTIYTPVDNARVAMRPIMTSEEAHSLMGDIKDIDAMWIPEERKRESSYKEAMLSCDSKEWVRIIKTVYYRQKERLANGKKMISCDERYFHLAEENLYGELAIPLEMAKEEVRKYVLKEVEKSE